MREFRLGCLAVFLGLVLACSGCGAWEQSKDFYKGYVNPDPTIDLDREGLSGDGEQRLSVLLSPVDKELERLARTMSTVDTAPSQVWLDRTRSRFPWLIGIHAMAADGSLMASSPSGFLRAPDIKPLLDSGEDWRKRRINAHAEITPEGPVVSLAMPFFVRSDFGGLTVAQFDPRTLALYSGRPDELYILSTSGLLWAGDTAIGQQLAALPWKDMLRSVTHGEERVGSRRFQWLARYQPGDSIIYAVEVPK